MLIEQTIIMRLVIKNVYGPKKELLLAIIMLVMPMLRKALDAFVT